MWKLWLQGVGGKEKFGVKLFNTAQLCKMTKSQIYDATKL